MRIFFTSGLVMFFYLKLRYLDNLVFISLFVNVLNILTCSKNFSSFLQLYLTSGTRNVKSTNLNTILACSRYFSNNSQPSLSDDKGFKDIDTYIKIVTTSIENTYIKNTYAKSISTQNTSHLKCLY